jgi:hypothetical protein
MDVLFYLGLSLASALTSRHQASRRILSDTKASHSKSPEDRSPNRRRDGGHATAPVCLAPVGSVHTDLDSFQRDQTVADHVV